MDNIKNEEFSIYRPGNLVRKNKIATIAWPGDLCIPENLAQVTPLDIDELVLRYLGFASTQNVPPSIRAYKRKISWHRNIEDHKRELEFYVLFRDRCIFTGLKRAIDPGEPLEMTELHFAHELQNHYADVTGVDELNVLSVKAKQ